MDLPPARSIGRNLIKFLPFAAFDTSQGQCLFVAELGQLYEYPANIVHCASANQPPVADSSFLKDAKAAICESAADVRQMER